MGNGRKSIVGREVALSVKGVSANGRKLSDAPLFAANSVRGIVSVDGNPLRLIFREGNPQEDRRPPRWGLIGGKIGFRECVRHRLRMELAEEAGLEIHGGLEAVRPVTTLHTPGKTIQNYPVVKVEELGFNTRGLDPDSTVTLSNPLTLVFYCRAIGKIAKEREGRRLKVIDFSDVDRVEENLRMVKPRHRSIVELWVRHQFSGEGIPCFLEYGTGVVGTEEDVQLALAANA